MCYTGESILQHRGKTGMDQAHTLLKRYYGYDQFRPGQEEIIRALLRRAGCAGRHAHRGGQIGLLPDPGP